MANLIPKTRPLLLCPYKDAVSSSSAFAPTPHSRLILHSPDSDLSELQAAATTGRTSTTSARSRITHGGSGGRHGATVATAARPTKSKTRVADPYHKHHRHDHTRKHTMNRHTKSNMESHVHDASRIDL